MSIDTGDYVRYMYQAIAIKKLFFSNVVKRVPVWELPCGCHHSSATAQFVISAVCCFQYVDLGLLYGWFIVSWFYGALHVGTLMIQNIC